MNGQIYIDNLEIGKVNFKIIDESMGGIGGEFVETENYNKFKAEIQNLTEKNGNANSQNLNFKIFIENIELKPAGGICLIDSKEFSEKYLDASGINLTELEKLNL